MSFISNWWNKRKQKNTDKKFFRENKESGIGSVADPLVTEDLIYGMLDVPVSPQAVLIGEMLHPKEEENSSLAADEHSCRECIQEDIVEDEPNTSGFESIKNAFDHAVADGLSYLEPREGVQESSEPSYSHTSDSSYSSHDSDYSSGGYDSGGSSDSGGCDGGGD